MTKKTLFFLTLDIALWLIALSTGKVIYYLPAVMMSVMALLGLESALLTLFTLKVRCEIPRKRLTRGENMAVRLRISRRTLLPTGPVELEVSVPDDGREVGHMSVGSVSFKEKEYRYNMRCVHRGVYNVGISRVQVTDIFRLFSFSRRMKKSALIQVEVAPLVGSADVVELVPSDSGRTVNVRMTEDRTSPSGVRTWQSGDRLKDIHWKLSARKKELMVRTYDESARPDVLILMDCGAVQAMRSHVRTIEDKLCETALSEAAAHMKAGYPVRMPLHTTHPVELFGQGSESLALFLREMTWLNFDSPYSFEQVAPLEMRRLQRTGAVIFVSAMLTPALTDVAAGARRAGSRVMYLWVTETVSKDTDLLLKQMEMRGIDARRINPWRQSTSL